MRAAFSGSEGRGASMASRASILMESPLVVLDI